jgi:hypothetical protein
MLELGDNLRHHLLRHCGPGDRVRVAGRLVGRGGLPPPSPPIGGGGVEGRHLQEGWAGWKSRPSPGSNAGATFGPGLSHFTCRISGVEDVRVAAGLQRTEISYSKMSAGEVLSAAMA